MVPCVKDLTNSHGIRSVCHHVVLCTSSPSPISPLHHQILFWVPSLPPHADLPFEPWLNNPEATEQTIGKEGWLHTGDVGYVDDDDEIFIVDRLKELIKYKGFQVAPAELEAMLITHPNIADAAVVPVKDVSCGELPVAFIVRSNGSEITEDEIKKYISKQVVFYKRIHRVFFIEAIPKAPSGKILRKELRAKIAAEHPNGHHP